MAKSTIRKSDSTPDLNPDQKTPESILRKKLNIFSALGIFLCSIVLTFSYGLAGNRLGVSIYYFEATFLVVFLLLIMCCKNFEFILIGAAFLHLILLFVLIDFLIPPLKTSYESPTCLISTPTTIPMELSSLPSTETTPGNSTLATTDHDVKENWLFSPYCGECVLLRNEISISENNDGFHLNYKIDDPKPEIIQVLYKIVPDNSYNLSFDISLNKLKEKTDQFSSDFYFGFFDQDFVEKQKSNNDFGSFILLRSPWGVKNTNFYYSPETKPNPLIGLTDSQFFDTNRNLYDSSQKDGSFLHVNCDLYISDRNFKCEFNNSAITKFYGQLPPNDFYFGFGYHKYSDGLLDVQIKNLEIH